MKNNSLKEIVNVLKKAKNPLFISHENPDGDTYGSSFALRLGMDRANCDLACGSKIDWPFTELNIKDTISEFNGDDYDLYVFLDCADDMRCGEKIKKQLSPNVSTMNIDHHQSNNFYGTYNYVLEAAATCELVHAILMQYKKELSKEVADYLYMGVASDTGLFVHSYTTSNTHYVAAKLLEAGAEFDRISTILFRTVTKNTALLTGCLFNNIEIIDDKIAISYLTIKDYLDTKANYEDSEGLIYQLTKIDKVKVCILLKQIDSNQFKASLRSTKDVDICLLALKYGGGGHKQAAGCKFEGKIEDIKKEILEQIKELQIL